MSASVYQRAWLLSTYLCDGMTCNIRVELDQIFHRLFRPVFAQRSILQEEVHSQIRLIYNRRIENREMADAWKDEVFEGFDTSDAWAAALNEKDVCLFQCNLTVGTLRDQGQSLKMHHEGEQYTQRRS